MAARPTRSTPGSPGQKRDKRRTTGQGGRAGAPGSSGQKRDDPNRMLSLNEAAALAGLSRDSILRHYQPFIRRLTPRRIGIRMRDVLKIGNTAAFNTSTATL
jgi:hypothetical protein